MLNNLLYAVIDPDECVTLAGKLIGQTSQDDVRFDALRFLAHAYNAKGNTAATQAALEQIPELYFTKLGEMAFVLTGKPKYDAAEKQKWISFENLLQMMAKLIECYQDDGNTTAAVAEAQRALCLLEALHGDEKTGRFDGYVGYFSRRIS